jgi:integrase
MKKGRRQRGCVIQKGNSYFAYFRDNQGKQKWLGENPGQGFKSYGEARRRLNEVLVEIDRALYVKPKAGTFAEFADEWLAGRVSIEGSTLAAYASIIRRHLVPNLGELQMVEIERAHVQNLAKTLAKNRSRKTLGNVMTLLNTMLDGKFGQSAVKDGYIRHNPAKGVELPPDHGEEIIPPTAEQVSLLVLIAREIGGIGYAIVLLAVSTGMRRGEILALRYSDIDWLSNEISIQQAIKKAAATDGVHKWQWKLGPPKSRKSRRRIGMTQTVRSLLAGLKEIHGDGDDFIFPRRLVGLKPPGHWIDPDYFNDSIYGPIAQKAGLKEIRFHDLRHFFASVLIAQGESAKYVQDQMGHSSIQVTFDTYGHLFPQAKQESVRKLDATLAAALSSKPLGCRPNDLLEGTERKSDSKNELLESLLEKARPKSSKDSREKRLN